MYKSKSHERKIMKTYVREYLFFFSYTTFSLYKIIFIRTVVTYLPTIRHIQHVISIFSQLNFFKINLFFTLVKCYMFNNCYT